MMKYCCGLGFVGGGTPPPSPAPSKPQASFGSPSGSKSGLSLGAVLLQGAQGRLVLEFRLTIVKCFAFFFI